MDALPLSREVSLDVIKMTYQIKHDLSKPDQLQSLAYFLEYLILHLPEPRIEPAFAWLIKNGITGKRFNEFVMNECGGSPFTLFREITKRIENEKERRTILAKDMNL